MKRIALIATVLAILAALGHCSVMASAVAVPSGEPDANCQDLRLWLRADAGVRDARGRTPADADFSGSVAVWSDQSPRHFDVAALPEHTPYYVMRQSGAGNRPTVAFGAGRMLVRSNDTLHEHVNSTTFLVLQILRGSEQGKVVFCAGDPGGKREVLSFEHNNELDAAQAGLRWFSPAQNNDINVYDPLHIAADGRFAIITIRSAGENSSVEFQDGLGDFLGSDREVPPGIAAASNRCGRGYCLGGQKLDQPYTSYDGQIAEVMVYNRDLTSAERHTLIRYLRRKYELDVLDALYPAGAMLMQAEDFDGAWELNARWDSMAMMCLGQRHVTSKGQQNNEGIKRSVLISQPGNYSVWVRAVNIETKGGLRTTVGGKQLGVTHAEGPMVLGWQLAGSASLPQGETEIVVRGEGPGRRECDAVFIGPSVTTLTGVEEICALARRLRLTPSPGEVTAVFEDGRRIEGNLVSGWRGSGASIARDGSGRVGVRCLQLDCPTADPASQSDALLEFHNGDRMRGTICGYMAASTGSGQSVGAQLFVTPSQEFSKSADKPILVYIDWLRRIVFDESGPPRRCPPRSLVCRDGRVIAFRALRFSGDGVSVLTDRGLLRLAYRELAEIAMQPIDAWEAYYRQLAVIDPRGDAGGIVRLETEQGMVFTASALRATAFREEAEAASSACRVQPAWSRTPIPVAWSAVRTIWRAPAHIVPLSLFVPQQVWQRGALGSSWTWQVDRNVAGGELRSGGLRYLWGFGVHAPNALAFNLPASVLAFRSGLGIDAAVGDSGRVKAKVYVNAAAGTPLLEGKSLLGSRTVMSTGDLALSSGGVAAQRLVLVVADDRDARQANADPMDIGDHADWLEPTLMLDPLKLREAVNKYRPAVK